MRQALMESAGLCPFQEVSGTGWPLGASAGEASLLRGFGVGHPGPRSWGCLASLRDVLLLLCPLCTLLLPVAFSLTGTGEGGEEGDDP